MNKKAIAVLEVVGLPTVSSVRSLALGSTLNLPGTRDSTPLVYCLTGTLWVTRGGNPEDIILRSGETRKVDGRGPLVISAFEDSRLTVQ